MTLLLRLDSIKFLRRLSREYQSSFSINAIKSSRKNYENIGVITKKTHSFICFWIRDSWFSYHFCMNGSRTDSEFELYLCLSSRFSWFGVKIGTSQYIIKWPKLIFVSSPTSKFYFFPGKRLTPDKVTEMSAYSRHSEPTDQEFFPTKFLFFFLLSFFPSTRSCVMLKQQLNSQQANLTSNIETLSGQESYALTNFKRFSQSKESPLYIQDRAMRKCARNLSIRWPYTELSSLTVKKDETRVRIAIFFFFRR